MCGVHTHIVATFGTCGTIGVAQTLLAHITITDVSVGGASVCFGCRCIRTLDAGVACTIWLRCGSRSVLSCAVVVVVGTCATRVGTFHTLVLVAVRLASIGVLPGTNAAGSDVVIGTLHARPVGTVIFLEDALAICREAILSTLNTEVACVTERAVRVLTCTGVGLLVGLRTFHTLVLFTVGHSRVLE